MFRLRALEMRKGQGRSAVIYEVTAFWAQAVMAIGSFDSADAFAKLKHLLRLRTTEFRIAELN
jgi:hypothetical protein